jgi:hypothetical protein
MDEQKIGACGDEVEHEDGSRLLEHFTPRDRRLRFSCEVLRNPRRLQDCVMSGRSNYAPSIPRLQSALAKSALRSGSAAKSVEALKIRAAFKSFEFAETRMNLSGSSHSLG